MGAAPDSIETDRLLGERLRPHHLDDLDRFHSDARVMATLGGLRSRSQTVDYLDESLAHWDRFGFGLYLLRARTDGALAGRAGLRHAAIGGEDVVELAYAIAADYWGRGLATEIGRSLVALGFGPLELAEIAAFTTTTNHASRRVLEKLGFRYERDFERGGLPHVLYRLRRAG